MAKAKLSAAEEARVKEEDAKLRELIAAVGWVRTLEAFDAVFPKIDLNVTLPPDISESGGK